MGVGVAVYVGVGVTVGVGVVVEVSADKPFWPEMIPEPSAVWSIRIGPEAETAVARESIMIQTMTQILRGMGIAAFHEHNWGWVYMTQGRGVKQKQTAPVDGEGLKFEIIFFILFVRMVESAMPVLFPCLLQTMFPLVKDDSSLLLCVASVISMA